MSENRAKRLPKFRQTTQTTALITKLMADPNEGRYTRTQGNDGVSPAAHSLGALSKTITNSINDSENILATLPDTELTMLVVVSSIMSPNDMRNGELTWSYDFNKISPELGGKLLDYLKSYFEDEYLLKKKLPKAIEHALFKTGSYPLIVIPESSVDDMINGKAAISTESIKAILDDKFITKSKGILGPGRDPKATKVVASGIESMLKNDFRVSSAESKFDEFVHVTDNLDALKIPLLFEQKRKIALRSKLAGAGLESLYDTGNLEISLQRNRHLTNKEMMRVLPSSKASRAPIGHPMVILSPSDALIPAHSPSAPEDHLGYYLLLDDLGYPLSNATDSNYYQQLQNNSNTKPDDATSAMLKRSRFMQEGMYQNATDDRTLDALSQSYAKMLEMDLLERLRNGVYGEAVDLQHPEEIYRIMFARLCAGQRTQILYIPVELVTYFAYDYNSLGIGIGLLEKSKFLASVRSMLTYANVMGQMSNSVPRRNLTITLDEDDLEPEKTVNLVLGEYQRINNGALPFDGGRPLDVVNGIRNANTSVNVVGNPMFPETNISVEDVSLNRQAIDMSLDEDMAKRHGMALGVTPDLIDSTATIEFAVQQLNSNLLFTKRIAMQQEVTSGHIKDHVHKYTVNSGTLMAGMIRIIREFKEGEEAITTATAELSDTTDLLNGLDDMPEPAAPATPTDPNAPAAPVSVAPPVTDEPPASDDPYSLLDVKVKFEEKREQEQLSAKPKVDEALSELSIIDGFLDTLSITLPPPDSTKIANQMDSYSQFAQAVDAVLPAYVNEEMLAYKYGDEGRDSAPLVITMIKGYFLRQYLAQNNIMPELKALVSNDGDDVKMLNMLEASELHLDSMASTVGSLLEVIMKRYAKPEEGDMGGDYSGGSDMGGSDTGGDYSGNDDFGGEGGDALDFDLDIGEDLGEETPEAETTETEAPAEAAPAESAAPAEPEATPPSEGAQ